MPIDKHTDTTALHSHPAFYDPTHYFNAGNAEETQHTILASSDLFVQLSWRVGTWRIRTHAMSQKIFTQGNKNLCLQIWHYLPDLTSNAYCHLVAFPGNILQRWVKVMALLGSMNVQIIFSLKIQRQKRHLFSYFVFIEEQTKQSIVLLHWPRPIKNISSAKTTNLKPFQHPYAQQLCSWLITLWEQSDKGCKPDDSQRHWLRHDSTVTKCAYLCA